MQHLEAALFLSTIMAVVALLPPGVQSVARPPPPRAAFPTPPAAAPAAHSHCHCHGPNPHEPGLDAPGRLSDAPSLTEQTTPQMIL